MTSPLRALMHTLRGLFVSLMVLCLLAQPVLAAAHELHEAEHALADAAAGALGVAVDDASPAPGTVDSLLHMFDCCLHATAAPVPVLTWTAHSLQSLPPRVSLPVHTPSPFSRFLRPPIAA
jgi:hypothetical protein